MLGESKAIRSNDSVESKTVTKRTENKDGSSETITVEEVEGGFIKTTSCRYKDKEGEWQYSDKKSVHMENPLEEKSLIDKLATLFGGKGY